jgi:membrane protease YdiL (CAAX protease family)
VNSSPTDLLKERRLELAVFLFLIIPPMAVAYVPGRHQAAFVLFAASTIATDLAFVFLVLFFLWRNGESFARCGLGRTRFGREIFVGVLLYPVIGIFIAAAESVFQRIGLSKPAATTPQFLTIHGKWQMGLAVVLVLIVAFSEEVLFRGYLLLRFGELQKRRAVAIILSSALFSLGHGYEGTAGIATVLGLSVLLCAIRLWRDNLTAPIVIHVLQDLLGIVLAPLAKK